MSYTYAEKKKSDAIRPAAQVNITQRMDALQKGTARPTAAEMGRRVDLPDAMRAKMENAFGADLSAVKLYESQRVADAGAEAVTRGNDIAFAPGMLDFTSYSGQALLGHEMSHVVSQARGEVRGGGGFLNDRALEARADREGAMAATGQQVYAAPTAAMSSASAASAAGPMQAMKKKDQKDLAVLEARRSSANGESGGMLLPDDNTPLSAKEERRYQKLNAKAWKEKQKAMSKGAFYDYVESLLGDDPTNAKGDIPQYAVKWYQEHKKKGSRQSGKKGWDVENPFLPSGQDPMADHSADFAMLNSGEGTAAEYTQAYDNIAVPTAKNMTNEQKKSIRSYMGGSEPINSYLRNETDNPVYPSKKTLPTVQKEIADISQGLQNNPLQGNISTYKGITDKYLAMMFRQFGLKEAFKEDGGLNHEWMGKNQDLMKKTLVGKTFHDKGYTSTTTEPEFAKHWAKKKAQSEHTMDLMMKGKGQEAMDYENEVRDHPEKIKGAHMVKFNLPKGANASFVDRAGDTQSGGRYEQREVLVDKGSSFKVSDFRKLEDSDAYELVMDMLADEDDKKRK